jgi:hypothetical protein
MLNKFEKIFLLIKMQHIQKHLVCAVVCAVLFFLLSPGVLLTLPPVCKGGFLMQLKEKKGGCATSYTAAAVHALVFGVVCFFVCQMSCN